MLIYTPEKIIFDGSLTTLTDILSCALAKMGKSRNDFKFSASVGRFPSDSSERVKLKECNLQESKEKTKTISVPFLYCGILKVR